MRRSSWKRRRDFVGGAPHDLDGPRCRTRRQRAPPDAPSTAAAEQPNDGPAGDSGARLNDGRRQERVGRRATTRRHLEGGVSEALTDLLHGFDQRHHFGTERASPAQASVEAARAFVRRPRPHFGRHSVDTRPLVAGHRMRSHRIMLRVVPGKVGSAACRWAARSRQRAVQPALGHRPLALDGGR